MRQFKELLGGIGGGDAGKLGHRDGLSKVLFYLDALKQLFIINLYNIYFIFCITLSKFAFIDPDKKSTLFTRIKFTNVDLYLKIFAAAIDRNVCMCCTFTVANCLQKCCGTMLLWYICYCMFFSVVSKCGT